MSERGKEQFKAEQRAAPTSNTLLISGAVLGVGDVARLTSAEMEIA